MPKMRPPARFQQALPPTPALTRIARQCEALGLQPPSETQPPAKPVILLADEVEDSPPASVSPPTPAQIAEARRELLRGGRILMRAGRQLAFGEFRPRKDAVTVGQLAHFLRALAEHLDP